MKFSIASRLGHLALAIHMLAILAVPAAASAPVAAERLEAKVDALFAKWDTTVSPGCAVAIAKDGKIIYQRGYGMADLEHGVPNSPTTIFHIASVSKQFAAASVVLLAQDGKLSLDDEVRKYVPELADFGAPVTIRQLIHHTSGLRDQWDLLDLAGWRYSHDLITDDDVMHLVTRQRQLNFAPNSKYSYSNTGYTLLAQIVQRVSGQSFREFTTARIFEPLGMRNSHFRDDFTEIVPNIAYGYRRDGDVFKTSVTNFNTVGATSLLTTVQDLLRWDENFYQPVVGGEALIRQMQQQGVLNDGKQIEYAFGLEVSKYRGLRTVRHSGSDAGYRAQFLRFPEQHFSVVCLCNAADAGPSDRAESIADIYLEKELVGAKPRAAATALTMPAGVRLTKAQSQRVVGSYLNRDYGGWYRVSQQGDKLQITNQNRSSELVPLGGNRFLMAGKTASLELTFSAPSDRQAFDRLTVMARFEEPTPHQRVDEFAPTPAQLSDYVGSYRSDELDVAYRVVLEGGALQLQASKKPADGLQAVTRDLFSGEIGSMQFNRDAAGRVAGFDLTSGRIKDVRFVRQSAGSP
ncbi:serine hydrolase domain-containing protein [Steroidobacter sp.]|uniref:serine hydrolase domain-containing protein n=1 Tax=Steroidobacter sp. TaxID=1978227 RepID=UPI001A5DF905|nr:serine hydrolase domain-containing protein [Steroidobacter sp.]MBL8271575.1 serine hydrolase [Steroidobacter sp.]